jgi:glycine/D-amino acid oxidase-like deaminating enzyme
MLPVLVHVPGVCAVVIAAGVWSADLLNTAKVIRTPIEQRAKPIKTRGLKKADREADFFA